jgi:hypothetical protein
MNTVTHHHCGCGIEHRIQKSIFKSKDPNVEAFDQYKVKLGDRYTPVMDEYKEMAVGMDKNRNGIISNDEILPPVSKIGHAQVDQPDFCHSFKHKMAGWSNPYADHYPSAAQIGLKMDGLAEAHPGMVHKAKIGETAEGRDILAYRIGHGEEGEKPGVLVTGGQHAREWAGNGAVSEAVEKLLTGYNSDPEMKEKVDGLEMWFVPMVNPDGYEYSRNADPDWRKNRARHPGYEGVGTDLNRNYRADFRFHGDVPKRQGDDAGASDDPNKLTFRGPHALSERETQSITNFMDTRPNLKGVLDVHGFGRMILFPGADEERDAHYREVADKINAALDDKKYTPLAIPELYPTTGDMSAYGEKLGMLSMGLEIGTSFQPHPDKIDDITNRGSNAIIAFIDQVAEENLPPEQLANIV